MSLTPAASEQSFTWLHREPRIYLFNLFLRSLLLPDGLRKANRMQRSAPKAPITIQGITKVLFTCP